LRTIIWFIYFWLYLIAAWPVYLRARYLARRGRTGAHDALVRKVTGNWARRLIALAGGRVRVEGLEHLPAGPAVYVSNHLGYFDVPLVLGYLGDDTKPLMAKAGIARLPLIRQWMRELHCVFIDRDHPRQAMAALSEAEHWVAEGYAMTVFPEGTRSADGRVGEFKAGAFRIAQKNQVPVVPFVIAGTDRMMRRGSLAVHPAAVTLTVLPPIDTSGFSRKDWKALPEQARARIVAAQSARGGADKNQKSVESRSGDRPD
jgi:1-acyl-sn-glycerol-3-phosphate acyltransferase